MYIYAVYYTAYSLKKLKMRCGKRLIFLLFVLGSIILERLARP